MEINIRCGKAFMQKIISKWNTLFNNQNFAIEDDCKKMSITSNNEDNIKFKKNYHCK